MNYDYDLKANEENIKIFKKYGAFVRENEKIYTCVLCGEKISIDDATSLSGHKLICIQCVFDKFDGYYGKSKEWQKDKSE